MEYIEARKSFICFDEPEFKAIFKLTIIHDNSLFPLTNMPVNKTTNLFVFLF